MSWGERPAPTIEVTCRLRPQESGESTNGDRTLPPGCLLWVEPPQETRASENISSYLRQEHVEDSSLAGANLEIRGLGTSIPTTEQPWESVLRPLLPSPSSPVLSSLLCPPHSLCPSFLLTLTLCWGSSVESVQHPCIEKVLQSEREKSSFFESIKCSCKGCRVHFSLCSASSRECHPFSTVKETQLYPGFKWVSNQSLIFRFEWMWTCI